MIASSYDPTLVATDPDQKKNESTTETTPTTTESPRTQTDALFVADNTNSKKPKKGEETASEKAARAQFAKEEAEEAAHDTQQQHSETSK